MELNLNEFLIFKREFIAEEFDEQGNLSLKTLFSNFSNAAVSHADLLGIGNKFIKENNKLFVIVRMRIQIVSPFEKGEKCTIVTYPTKPGKIQIGREAIFYGEDGNERARLTSLWVLLDGTKRRLTLLTPVIEILNPYLEELEKAPQLFEEGLTTLDIDIPKHINPHKYVVTPDNIDTNGHMNNAIYAEIIDSIGYTRTIKQIEINFEKECMLDETLTSYEKEIEDGIEVIGYKEDDSISYKVRINY